MQLICKYGDDAAHPDLGVVVERIDDDTAHIDMSGRNGAVLIPFHGDFDALERFGPEPELLGDPPTAIAPGHAELDAAGVPHTIFDQDGQQVTHPLRAMAGKVYPDNRRRAMDARPRMAPELTPDTLKAFAASERYNREIAGIVFEAMPISTDRASQAAIEKLASRASRDAKYAPTFKGSNGATQALTNAQILALADAVGDRTDALRAAEEKVVADIDTGKIVGASGLSAITAALARIDA